MLARAAPLAWPGEAASVAMPSNMSLKLILAAVQATPERKDAGKASKQQAGQPAAKQAAGQPDQAKPEPGGEVPLSPHRRPVGIHSLPSSDSKGGIDWASIKASSETSMYPLAAATSAAAAAAAAVQATAL